MQRRATGLVLFAAAPHWQEAQLVKLILKRFCKAAPANNRNPFGRSGIKVAGRKVSSIFTLFYILYEKYIVISDICYEQPVFRLFIILPDCQDIGNLENLNNLTPMENYNKDPLLDRLVEPENWKQYKNANMVHGALNRKIR
jgi:hypothetical protein